MKATVSILSMPDMSYQERELTIVPRPNWYPNGGSCVLVVKNCLIPEHLKFKFQDEEEQFYKLLDIHGII